MNMPFTIHHFRKTSGLMFACFSAALVFSTVLFFGSAHAHAATNLISNPSLETEASDGTPVDWIQGRWGDNTAAFTYPVAGFTGGKAGKVEITRYGSGDAKWAFKRVPIEGGKEYVFSDRFRSSVTSYVTAEFKHANGALSYQDLLVLGPSSDWKEAKASFAAPSDAVSVSVFHLIKSVGEITVDEFSLTKTPASTSGNLIPNASFESTDGSGNPAGWIQGRWGSNNATFSYPVTGHDGNRAASVSLTARISGDAKWAFEEIPVVGGATYVFSDYYKADVPTYITLRYKMADGSLRYPDLAVLPAASNWQRTEHMFTAPQGAVSVMVFHLINRVGTLSVDSYRLTRTSSPFSGGLVTLTFDDGTRSIYDNAIPILNTAGLKSTQYIVTGRFNFPGYVNEAEVLELQSAGHEIGAHTVTHANLTELSSAEAREEIEGSRQDLLDIGVRSVRTLAYPFGAFNDEVKQMVRNAGFETARSTFSGYNDVDSDLFELKRQPVNISNSASQVKSWIDAARANDKWLVLALHHVNNSGAVYSTTPETLQEIVTYLKGQSVRVKTLSEAYDLFR